MHADLDRLRGRTPLRRVHAGKPEQVVHEAADPAALGSHPLEGMPIPGGIPILAERQAGLRLDDRKGGSQLVRGVGGELELALPGKLDRSADPPADEQRAAEDQQQQDDADQRSLR